MTYTDPSTVYTPKGRITDLKVLHDGGQDSWSLATMKWDGAEVIGMRWNGGMNNGKPTVGNPQSRGKPTWFVLPSEVGDAIKKMLDIPMSSKK